jgi:hypothetical protein
MMRTVSKTMKRRRMWSERKSRRSPEVAGQARVQIVWKMCTVELM